jgi:lysophospholipase L1-like esterase
MTWPHLVIGALKDEYPDMEIDYVNAAVPGYTVKSSLRNFRTRIAPLRPDVTIIYHATNDLSWEIRDLASEKGIYREPAKQAGGWLAEHSQLWFLVVKNLQINALQGSAPDSMERLQISPPELGEHFRNSLLELVKEVKSVSGVVVLVTFSHQIRREQTPEQQLAAAVSAMYYMPFVAPRGLLAAYDRYNQIIADVASETGSVLIAGEEMVPGDNVHFNDSVHFKDAGSRIMALRVSQGLMKSPGFQSLVARKME